MKTKLQNGQKLTRQYRNARLSACDGIRTAELDEQNRVVKDVSVSSDEPYERWYGTEILLHGPKNVDLSRVKTGAAPLLYNHDRDAFVGKVMNPQLRDGKLYVDFKFSQNETAAQMLSDLRDGLLTECSIGYDVNKFEVDEDEETYTATLWTLYECSLVTVPADFTVGVGRADESEGREVEILIREKSRISEKKDIDTRRERTENQLNAGIETRKNMTPEEQAAADEKARKQREADEKREAQERNEKVLDGIKAAREREKEINDIAARATVPDDKKGEFERAHEKAIEKAITDEKAVADFQTYVFKNFWGKAKPLDTPSGQGSGDIAPAGGKRHLSVGETFMQSAAVKSLNGRLERGKGVGVEIPNLSTIGIRGKVALAQRAGFTSSDLSAVNVTIAPGIIALGVQRLTIMDVIGSGTIGTGAYKYARENSFGTVDGVAVAAGAMPRAKAVGERGLKPNWDPDLTTETANVCKVAVTTKVPDEFLSDFPSAMSYIDDRMPLMVDTETEFQILYGDGLNNNLKGIFTMTGVQTRAITTTDDSTKAASIRQGLTDVQVGAQFEPDFIGFHPYDWETACLLKDSTGRFLAGGPFYIPYTAGVFLEVYTFWGKRVVVSTAITYGKPIAGAGKIGAAALIREGMRIEMTNSNEDDFRRNLMCLRAEHRLALPVYRPVAFIEFTGWPARA